MNSDALRVLGRLRHHAVDAARRELAAGLRAAADAEARQRMVEAVVAHEAATAADPEAEIAVSTAFATWRQHGQTLFNAARETSDAAELAVARSLVAVATARAAAELVEVMRAEQARTGRAAALRAEQAILDEYGARAGRWRQSTQ